MKIKFDLEGQDEDVAFFALYAGLRMYKEHKDKQVKLQNEFSNSNGKEMFSIASVEAYCLLEDLREKFPKKYAEAKEEYDNVYGIVND